MIVTFYYILVRVNLPCLYPLNSLLESFCSVNSFSFQQPALTHGICFGHDCERMIPELAKLFDKITSTGGS